MLRKPVRELFWKDRLSRSLFCSVPLMVTNFINAVYNLTDGLWVAQPACRVFCNSTFGLHGTFYFTGYQHFDCRHGDHSQLIGAGERERAESYATHVFYFVFHRRFFPLSVFFIAFDCQMDGRSRSLRESARNTFYLMTGFEMVYLSFYAMWELKVRHA